MRRTRLILGMVALAAGLAAAACGSSATTAPTAPPPTPAPPTVAPATQAPAGSAPAVVMPSIAIPSFAIPSGLLVDASKVVTADMASSVIGGTATAVQFPGNLGGMASVAAYTNAAGDTMAAFVEKVPGGIPAVELQAAIAMAGSNGELQPVSGVGDAAGKVVKDHQATLAVARAGVILVLDAQSGTAAGSDLEGKLEALAQQVLGKL